MKKITLLFALCAVLLGFSQSLPVDFQSGVTAGDNWNADSGMQSATVESVPGDSSGNGLAGKIVSSASDDTAWPYPAGIFPWQNAQLSLQTNFIDLRTTTNQTITMDVYSETAIDFLVKLEQTASGAAVTTETSFSHTGTGWESISVNFGALTTPPNDQFKLLVLFPNYNAAASDFHPQPFASTTYVDNINGPVGDAISTPSGPTTNASTPTVAEADVISFYSDAYNDVSGINFDPDWGQATAVNTAYDPTGAGTNTVIEYSNFNYQGVDFPATDLSAMSHVHLDVWTDSETGVRFTPISPGQESPTALNPTSGEWTSIDLPLSTWANVDFTNVNQFKFDGGASGGTVYVDNIYFYNSPLTAPITNAPTPTQDAADVISVYSDSYNNVTVTNFNPGWGQSGTVDAAYDPTGEGNNTVLAYNNFNYQGTDLESTDVSGMDYVHLDVWTANGQQLKFTPISNGAEYLVDVALTSGSWSSVDIPLSDFTGVTLDNVIQLKFDGQPGTSDIYIDNIYFWKEPAASGNSVTVETSQAWNGYINAFNVSDDAYAFGFGYGVADLRATATATSMTLEPNIAIWTAEAANTAWFDNSSGTQTPVKYIEASSFIEDNSLAGSDLTFSGTVSSNDLNANYTVLAFIKALDPNNGYATVVNETASLTGTTGAFTVSATAAQLASGLIVQYGFMMTGLPADPNDATLGSLVVGEVPAPDGPMTSAPTPPARDAADVFSLLSDAYTNETPAGGLGAFAGATIEDYVIGGTDNTLKVTAPNAGGGYQYVFGIPNGVDLSPFTHMHIDYYTMGDVSGGEVLQTFLQQFAADGAFQHNIINTAAVTTTGSWVSIDVEIATMASGDQSRDNIGQIQMVLAGPAYGPVYLDNIYFYREPDPCLFTEPFAHTFDEVVDGAVVDAACWGVVDGGDVGDTASGQGYWTLFGSAGDISWGIYYTSAAHDDYLISPPFSVSDGLTDGLSFLGYQSSDSYPEPIDVIVYDAALENVLGVLATDLVMPAANTDNYVYDLSAYEGQNVRIAFYTDTTDQFGVFIDNFTVNSYTSLGVDSPDQLIAFDYFPNPVTDELTIKAQSNIDAVEVLNMLGQTVLSSTPSTMETQIDMNALQTGAYFVRVSINGQQDTFKILKN